ncbi:hypothetical protein [Paraburkholderia aromaticivorans]|uniref:hypothetical protein n=1 Tax=Paraburkholderia aromaticivorans TaxID=2026199 RepID=UPI00142D450E|nr:hypothetical protein [Paraburkholderia aromaticivorans]
MSERESEISELAKSILGNIVQGALAGGKIVDAQVSAELAVLCATALVDKLADSRN